MIRAELAAAVRRINAAFGGLPADAQDRLDLTVDPVEAEVDRAVLAGDRDRALAAIRRWGDHWLAEIGRAER